MASDANLIQGAYAAAGSGKADLAASQGMTKIGNMIAQPVAKALKQRRNEFKNFAQWELSRNPGLNDTEYADKHNQLMQMKSDYLYGDSLSRSQIMREMNEMKASQEGLDDAKKNFAKAGDDPEGFNKEFMESERGQKIVNAMKGAPVWKDGVMGYEIDGTFYDENGINELIQQESFDKQSSNVLSGFVENIVDMSKQQSVGGPTDFSWDENFRKIKKSLVSKGTMRSLAKDEIIPGRNFYDDFVDNLQTGTYGELGLDEAMMSQMDPTPEDGITYEDATRITDSLLEDGQMASHYISTYYTRYLEQNWNGVQNKAMNQGNEVPFVNQEGPQNQLQGTVVQGPRVRNFWSVN